MSRLLNTLGCASVGVFGLAVLIHGLREGRFSFHIVVGVLLPLWALWQLFGATKASTGLGAFLASMIPAILVAMLGLMMAVNAAALQQWPGVMMGLAIVSIAVWSMVRKRGPVRERGRSVQDV